MTPHTITIEDILAGVEKAAQSLPVEMVEEARQDRENYNKLLQTQRQHDDSWKGSTENFKE